jgi:hypothetical protein
VTPLKRLLTNTTSLQPVYGPAVIPFIAGALGVSTAVASVIFYIGATVITSWAMSALAPRPDFSNLAGLLTNKLEGVASQQYVYGRVRKGGTITFYESSGDDNKYLHMVICLAGHEVDSIGDIYINDEVVTLDGSGFVTGNPWKSKIRIKKHTGSDTQVADSSLVSETSATTAFRGQGIAYIYARLEYDQDVFVNGIPTITAVVDGKKVYNPATEATLWSSNAALCIRDYLTDERGLGDTSIDDTMLAVSVTVSDEDVSLAAGGTEKRYSLNGVISADDTPGAVLQRMMTACAGTLFWGQGAWKLKVGYYTPPVKDFTVANLRSSVSIQTRTSIADSFNAVVGTFNDADQDWVTADYPKLSSTAFLAEDDGVETELDLELPMTTSSATAQRIQKLTLFRGREQVTFNAEFDLTALEVQVGDIVSFTHDRYGWSAKEFEVVGWKFFTATDTMDMRVAMTLRETSEAAFDWTAEESEIIANNSTLPDAWTVPGIGIALTSQTRVIFEKLTNVITVNVTTAGGAFVERVEVQFRNAADEDWNVVGVGAPGRYEIIDVGDDFYDVRVRGYNQFGVRGEWNLYENYQVSGLAEPPADVTRFHGQVVGGSIALEWTPVPDLDLSHYKIRYAIEEAGASFANATTAVDKVPRPGSSIIIPARPGTYMIRAVDKSGNASSAYTSVVIPEAAFETFTHVDTQVEHATFTGTKTDCEVVSGELRITSGLLATYEFSDVIDLSTARRVRSRIDLAVTRYDPSLGLFDALPGLFDALSGPFDDLTGGASFADTDVRMFIAVSQDASTWGDWQLFKGGDFYGRAFKFKVELVSETSGVTPSISELTAKVWHSGGPGA